MLLKLNDESCSGCSACYEICQVSAIEFKNDDKGFLYPIIDQSKCIQCGECIKVCQCRNQDKVFIEKEDSFPIAYGVVNKKPEIRFSSQSGGLFAGLAEIVLNMHGIVYGAGFNEDLSVKHLRIEELKQLNRLQGSKYVQSDVIGTFNNVASDLQKGLIVLYSGTSCQISGLILYLKRKSIQTENLITCDFICHGVPSPLIFKENLLFIERKYKNNILKVDFRNKRKYGWHSHIESYILSDGTALDLNYYTELFYSHAPLRQCCFICRYCNINLKLADITMGDFWGIEHINSNFYNDNKGVSLAIIHNQKGMEIFKNGQFDFFNAPIDKVLEHNTKQPARKPKYFKQFWADYKNKGYEYCLKKYTIYGGIPFKIKRKIFTHLHIW